LCCAVEENGLKWHKVEESGWPKTMFLGEYEHTVDDKGRITLPARFREAFKSGIVLTRGMDRCLYAYTRDEWRALVDSQLSLLNPLSPDGRRIQRFFFSGASETELDKQGRVMLPPALARHARLKRDVVVAGVNDHLEIWDRSGWRAQLKEIEGSAEDVAERLAAARN
jgi:MraZ protein